MNWKTAALKALGWRVLLVGSFAGLWAGVLQEAALWLPGFAGIPQTAPWLSGLGLGIGFGAMLSPAEALIHHYYQRAWRLAVAGAVLGGLAGVLGAGAGVALEQMLPLSLDSAGGDGPLSRQLAAVLVLALVGGASGIVTGLYPARGGRMRRGALLGLALGAGLGMLLAAVVEFTGLQQSGVLMPWAELVALVIWGAAVALGLHWWRKRTARRWLRLLTGINEDCIYPLRGPRLRLGKHERNDVPLKDYQEVYPYHCEVRWAGDHYDIVDNEQGGLVQVNYRQVREHALRPGDLVRVGTALLQYGEAS